MVRDRLHELKVGYVSDASGSNADNNNVTVAISSNTNSDSINITLEKISGAYWNVVANYYGSTCQSYVSHLDKRVKPSDLSTGRLFQQMKDSVVELYGYDARLYVTITRHVIRNAQSGHHSRIKQLLEIVKCNIEDMRKRTNDVVKQFYNPKDFSEAMNKMRMDNLSVYQNITVILKELENDLESPNDCSTVARMKFGLYHGNKEEIYLVWQDYTNFLIAYEEKIKKVLQRQALIAQHSLTEEETESLLENNRSIFTGNILQETESVRNNLKELVERYQELEKIEKSLREVKEMFIYMGTLVHQQGEVIQSIEYHAQLALSNVDNGAVELEKARDYKIKSLKKKTCILIWITVILSVLLLIVFVT